MQVGDTKKLQTTYSTPCISRASNLNHANEGQQLETKSRDLTMSRRILSFSIRSSSFLCSRSVLAWYIWTAFDIFPIWKTKNDSQLATSS